MIADDLMRKYKYGYVHSCNMLNEPFVKDLIKENQELKNQQKEFIEWLESEIERIPTLTTFFYNHEGHYVSETEVMLKKVNKVYKKYKEMIGVKDEDN